MMPLSRSPASGASYSGPRRLGSSLAHSGADSLRSRRCAPCQEDLEVSDLRAESGIWLLPPSELLRTSW